MAKKMMKKLKEEVEKRGLKLSVIEHGMEGKSRIVASCGLLEDELRQCNKEGVTMANSVETGSRLENQSQEFGCERESEKKEVQSGILAHKEEQGLPKELHEGGSHEVVTSGYGASKNVGSTCSGDGSYRKIEEADGSSSGQKEYDLVVLSSWKHLALKWKKSSQLWLLRHGQKGRGLANGTQNKKKHG